MLKYAIGCDHNGFEMKEHIIKTLNNYFYDFGVYKNNVKSDYPQVALKVAESVATKKFEKAVLICGTGIGMSIAANKVINIRSAVISDVFSAKFAILHNNINILCIGANIINCCLAIDIINIFFNTKFEEGRHSRRLNIISDYENNRKDKYNND